MKILRTSLILSFTLLIQFSSQAQEKFERLYRSANWDQATVDIQQTSDMGYLMLSVGKHPDSLEYSHVNVTKLEPKGDLAWSRNYDFEEYLLPVGQLTLMNADSFAFTTLFKKSGMNKMVSIANPNGDISWSKAYGQGDDTAPLIALGTVELPQTPDGGFMLFDEANAPNAEMDLYISRLDSTGNQLWGSTLNSQLNSADLGEELFDAQFTQLDSGYILAGMAEDGIIEMPLLVKLDNQGNVEWGKRYSITLSTFASAFARSVKPLEDTSYLVGGSYLTTSPALLSTGWVMKTDSIGNIIWAYVVGDPNILVPKSTRVKEVFPASDGGVIVLGEISDLLSQTSKPYLLKMQPDGTIDWQYGYFANGTGSISVNQFIQTADNGFMASGFSTETTAPGNFLNIPYLLKVDPNGSSSCEDTTSLAVGTPDIVVDSLIFNSQPVDTVQTLAPEFQNHSYSIPVLSLDAPSFCEGDPILHTFDATVPGAVSYEWSTGETTPMITVTQEGMYTVFVRVEEDVCYDMCDTTMINIIGPPTAEIIPNPDTYCLEGYVLLQAAGFDTYQWSTGETTQSIEATELGTYSVTITNQCDSAVASYNLTSFPEATDITIDVNMDNYCTTGEAGLLVSGFGEAPILWSTGDTIPFILVSDLPNNYTVTADFGDCGTRSAEVSLDVPLIAPDLEVIDSFCTADYVQLFPGINQGTAPLMDFEWSTGETTDTITVTEPGEYTLIPLSDFCDVQPISYTVNPCISEFDCVQFPNVFTPDGDTMNDTFWPYIPPECADIEVIELKIFSRWGELVFETGNSNQPWDGYYKGKPAGSDVYVYMVKMSNGAENTDVQSGELTLLR